MVCNICGGNQAQFPSEICIHSPGPENLDKPQVFEFATVLVCLECGFASFTVSETHLTLLADPMVAKRERILS
jgi:hypothetical protein